MTWVGYADPLPHRVRMNRQIIVMTRHDPPDAGDPIFEWLKDRPGRYRVEQCYPVGIVAFSDADAAFEFKMVWG